MLQLLETSFDLRLGHWKFEIKIENSKLFSFCEMNSNNTVLIKQLATLLSLFLLAPSHDLSSANGSTGGGGAGVCSEK